MPQMAPINWLSLMFIFCLTFIMFNILNYFSFSILNNKNNNKYKLMKKNNFNWKW